MAASPRARPAGGGDRGVRPRALNTATGTCLRGAGRAASDPVEAVGGRAPDQPGNGNFRWKWKFPEIPWNFRPLFFISWKKPSHNLDTLPLAFFIALFEYLQGDL